MTLQPNLSNSLIAKLLPAKMFVICVVMIHYSRDNLWSNLSFGTKSRVIILSIIKLESYITVIVITVFFTEFDFPYLRYTFYVCILFVRNTPFPLKVWRHYEIAIFYLRHFCNFHCFNLIKFFPRCPKPISTSPSSLHGKFHWTWRSRERSEQGEDFQFNLQVGP